MSHLVQDIIAMIESTERHSESTDYPTMLVTLMSTIKQRCQRAMIATSLKQQVIILKGGEKFYFLSSRLFISLEDGLPWEIVGMKADNVIIACELTLEDASDIQGQLATAKSFTRDEVKKYLSMR